MINQPDARGQPGYIALISALVISAALIVISVSAATASYFSRFNVLDIESKTQSRELAEGCAQTALLSLAQGINSLQNVNVDNLSCSIVSIVADQPGTGQLTIKTSATYSQAVTNLQTVINSDDLSLVSQEEVPN